MICKVCNEEINEFNILDPIGVNKHSLCNKCFNKFNVILEKKDSPCKFEENTSEELYMLELIVG